MAHEDQRHLRDWLQVSSGHTRVISTARQPMLPLLEAGTFSDTLYYRLKRSLLSGQFHTDEDCAPKSEKNRTASTRIRAAQRQSVGTLRKSASYSAVSAGSRSNFASIVNGPATTRSGTSVVPRRTSSTNEI